MAGSVRAETPTADAVATIEDVGNTIETSSPVVEVSHLNGRRCKLLALIDTDSPVSFIKLETFKNYRVDNSKIQPTARKLKNLSQESLDIVGIVRVRLTFLLLDSKTFEIDLHVLRSNFIDVQLI